MRSKNGMRLLSAVIVTAMLIGAFFIAVPRAAAAAPYYGGTFGAQEEIFDDLFLSDTDVLVAGIVHGMLVASGETVTIKSGAVIDDDAYLFGRTITVEDGAVIGGNLVIGGQNVIVNTAVARSLYSGGATLELGSQADIANNLFFGGFHLSTAQSARVGHNLYAGNYQSILNGQVGRNARINAAAVELNGEIDGDAYIEVGESSDSSVKYVDALYAAI